jgi:zinc/manganese transport system substrate-binding protein
MKSHRIIQCTWIIYFLFFSLPKLYATLNVLTTQTDLRAIAKEVGQEFISAESIGRGTQDPHYIEAKPSFMVKANRADLLISIGLDLEIGWLPSIIRGARNPKIISGQKGYLEVGPLVDPLEVQTGNITRAAGDVHPFGNPHVWLDPIRAGEIGVIIAMRLGELDPSHAPQFRENAKALQSRLQAKTKTWQERIDRTGVTKIVTYHKTLTYFLDRFKLQNPAILEPKPGIPPTSGHILKVMETMQTENIPLILVENFFDSSVTKKISASNPTIRIATVAVSVDGANGILTMDDLFETLVKSIEGRE